MQLAIIVSLIQGILAAAPSIIEGINRAKIVIEALFTAHVIDAPQQDALMAHVDALGAMAAAGIPPISWRVEPDPVSY